RRVRQSTTDRGTNTRRGTTDKVKRAPHTVSHLASNTGTNTGHITDRVANPTRQTAKRVSSILGTRPRGTRNLITEPRIRRRADAGHAAVSEVHNPVPDAPSSRAHGVGVRNNPASDPRPEAPHVRGTAVRLRGGLRGAVANRAEVTSGLIRGPVSRRSDRRTQIRELAADTRSDRVRTTKHLASRLIPGVYELVPPDLAADLVDVNTGLLPSLDGLLAVNRSRSGLIGPHLLQLGRRLSLTRHLLVRQVVPGFLVTGDDRGNRGPSLLQARPTGLQQRQRLASLLDTGRNQVQTGQNPSDTRKFLDTGLGSPAQFLPEAAHILRGLLRGLAGLAETTNDRREDAPRPLSALRSLSALTTETQQRQALSDRTDLRQLLQRLAETHKPETQRGNLGNPGISYRVQQIRESVRKPADNRSQRLNHRSHWLQHRVQQTQERRNQPNQM